MSEINGKGCVKASPVPGKRAGDDQKKLLLAYLEENLPVGKNQFDGAEGYKKLMMKWNEAAEILNKDGPARKTGAQWKKFFEDWRIRIKKKYTAIKQRMMASGQNGVFIEYLSDPEQKLVAIVTIDSIDGDGTTEELGFPNSTPSCSEPSTSAVSTSEATTSAASTSASLDDGSNDSSATSGSNGSSSSSGISSIQQGESVTGRKRQIDEEMELLHKLVKIDEQRFDLDMQRCKREEKAEQRASEEHSMKMEMYKAKLAILQQQLRN